MLHRKYDTTQTFRWSRTKEEEEEEKMLETEY